MRTTRSLVPGCTSSRFASAERSALVTSSQKDTFDAQRSQENLDAGKSKQLRTNVLFAVTGGVAVLTGVAAVFLVDWKGPSGESVKLGAGPGSLVLRSTF